MLVGHARYAAESDSNRSKQLHIKSAMTVDQTFRDQDFILAQLIQRITIVGISGDAVEDIGAIRAADRFENGLAHVVADLGTKLTISAIHVCTLIKLNCDWPFFRG